MLAAGDFYPDPNARFCCFNISEVGTLTQHIPYQPLALRLFVPVDALLSFVPSVHSHTDTPLEIPWEDWGPSHTHIIDLHANNNDIKVSAYGLRLLRLNRAEDGTHLAQVLDFHRHRVARAVALAETTDEASRTWTIRYGSTIDSKYMASGLPLVTQAPYIISERAIPTPSNPINLQLGEDCIVLKVRPRILEMTFLIECVHLGAWN